MQVNPILFKSDVIKKIRNTLDNDGFYEIVTPIIRKYAGDSGRPRLSLSNETYLRESSAYGLRFNLKFTNSVYEIGTSFRPDSIDDTHYPEFIMLDLYQANSSINDMLNLSKKILKLFYKGEIIEFSFATHIKEVFNIDLFNDSDSEEKLTRVLQKKYNDNFTIPLYLIDKYIKEDIEPLSIGKCIVIYDFPSMTEVRAKKKEGTKAIVERFEYLMNGVEIIHGYTDENNLKRFKENSKKLQNFGEEDRVMCELLEQGEVPIESSGFAIGIDRLCQLLLNKNKISSFFTAKPFSPFQD